MTGYVRLTRWHDNQFNIFLPRFYNCGWFGGSIPAAGITLGTRNIPNDWSWRLPLLLQCAPAFVVVCSALFLPESPRWLMAQGRDEEALAFLTKVC